MLHIYGSPLSPPTNKVRYLANYLHTPYEFHLVNLATGEHRKSEFLKINLYGKVPALDDDGFKLAESNAIIRYLANKQESILYPHELKPRALVDQWLDFISQHVATASSKILFNTYFYQLAGVAIDERSLQDGHQFLEQYLPIIEKQLINHPYVNGEAMTLADISLLSALDACEVIKINLSLYSHLENWRKNLMKQAFYTDCHESYTATFNKLLGHLLNTSIEV